MAVASSRDRLAAVAIVLFVIVLASVVRLWGLGWGTPYLHHPDEPVALETVQTMVRDRDINPHFFHWPSLPFYVQATSYSAYVGIGMLAGHFDGPADVTLPRVQGLGSGFLANPMTLTVGRLTTFAFSLGLVMLALWFTWWITRRIWIAGIAGSLAALEPMLVKNGRWMTPDTFAAFFAFGAIVAAAAAYRKGRWWQYALAGAFVGFAASSKYNAAAVAVAIVVAHFLRYRRAFFVRGGIYVAAAASIVAFVVTMPTLILAPSEAFAGITYDLSHYSTGHFGAEGDQIEFYARALMTNLGPLLLVIPLAFVARKIRPISIIVISYPIIQVLMLFRFVVRFERNLLPVMAPLVVLIAFGIMNGFDFLRKRSRKALPAVIVTVAVVAAMLVPGIQQLLRDGERYSGDHREEARSWFMANHEPGLKVVADSYSPLIDPTQFDVVPIKWVLATDQVFGEDADIVMLSRRGSGRFLRDPDRYSEQSQRYEDLLVDYCVVREFGGHEAVTFLSRDCET